MEARAIFLRLFERLEQTVDKLPIPLRVPILGAAAPLKDLFLKQRAPRLVVAGDPEVSLAGLFNALFSAPVAPFAPAGAVTVATPGAGSGPSSTAPGGGGAPPAPGWQALTAPGRGTLHVLDVRPLGAGGGADAAATAASAAERRGAFAVHATPDLVLFVRGSDAGEAGLPAQLAVLETLLARIDLTRAGPGGGGGGPVPVLGLVVAESEGPAPSDAALAAACDRLHHVLAQRAAISSRLAPTQGVATFIRFRMDGTFDPESDRRRHLGDFASALVSELPDEAKLEMARLSGAQAAQRKIAQTLVHSVSAASGALGVQPIPLADLPFLLAFQMLMVAGIIYVSGRELSLRLASEFLGALGANFGLGLVFRQGARTLSKLVPGLGNAISGLVAASGTYAVGHAATAYFIDGATLADARRIFRRQGRGPGSGDHGGRGGFRLGSPFGGGRRKSLPPPAGGPAAPGPGPAPGR